MKHERNYGIDLLRLVFMYMVCMLHTLGHGGIIETCESEASPYISIYKFMEVLSYYAVDGFAIISGYVANEKPRKYEKLVEMWFQAVFYSLGITVIFTALGINKSLGIMDIIRYGMPITFGKFWYFSAYVVLFISIPTLNLFLFSIDEVVAKKNFIIVIILFSGVGFIKDAFYTNWGYSAIWLIVLYCVGGLAKKIRLFETRSNVVLIALWVFCMLITWILRAFAGIDRMAGYTSPTMLLSAMIMVVLFSRLHIEGTIISKLSPLAFGVYLFQCNSVVWNNILDGAFAELAKKPIYIGIFMTISYAAAIFVAGLIVEYLRTKLAKVLRIATLSKKIVVLGNYIIEAVSDYLI